MPIPFLLGAVAVVAGAAGIGAGAYGAKKMYDANETMNLAKSKYDRAKDRVESENRSTIELMDKVGAYELEIINSFGEFSSIFEKIHNRPTFAEIEFEGLEVAPFTPDELKQASVGAATLLGGLGGAGLGAAAGFAASGATTAAVMAVGAASTGTAISSLSGVAATNAVLAFLGGGSLAAGGGGMALGSTLLGASTLGVGLLIGGAVFAFSGSKLSDKADEAYSQACRVEDAANEIAGRLGDIRRVAGDFYNAIDGLNNFYKKYLDQLRQIVEINGRTNYLDFTEDEKQITNITVNLVGLLFNACKTKLTRNSEEDPEVKLANSDEVYEEIGRTDSFLARLPKAS